MTRVSGDLILNDLLRLGSGHPEWPAGQEAKWYQAPVSALAYNDGVVLVGIRPGERRPARGDLDRAARRHPSSAILGPDGRAAGESPRGRRARGRLECRDDLGHRADARRLVVHADRRGRSRRLLRRRAEEPAEGRRNRAHRPGRPEGRQARRLLGARRRDGFGPDADLAVINKRSQGFYAEQTFKTLAAEKAGKGTWANAVALEKDFLASLGLDPTRYNLHDGSGLSPQNRVSAADIVKFLRAMNTQPNGPAWKATLATPADSEGTLRHRLHDPVARDRIAAKTGSIRGVSTLAGYATAVSGKTYAFAILLNGPGVWDGGGHAYQDRLLLALIHNG